MLAYMSKILNPATRHLNNDSDLRSLISPICRVSLLLVLYISPACRTQLFVSDVQTADNRVQQALVRAFQDAFDPGPTTREIAVYSDKNGLMLLDIQKNISARIFLGAISWCAVDNRAQAIWTLTKTTYREADNESLYKLEVIHRENPSVRHTISEIWASDVPEIRISHGPYGIIGGSDVIGGEHHGLQVTIGAKSKLEPYLNCRGDAEYNCYDFNSEGNKNALKEYAAKRQSELRRARLLNFDTLRELHNKSGDRRLWLEIPGSNSDLRIKIRIENCTEEVCGEGEPIGGTPYCGVITKTERGDYLHYYRQAYDNQKKIFIDITRPKVQSRQPIEGAPPLAEMLISRSGRAFMTNQYVADLERGILIQPISSMCGWLGGMYHYADPFPW